MEQELADEQRVLGEALKNALKRMGITQKDCEAIVGLSKSHLRTILQQGINPYSKTGELCLLVIRIYRSLYALVGGNQEHMKHWMHSPNRAFGEQAPVERMKQIDGLTEVLRYCDAMRAKV